MPFLLLEMPVRARAFTLIELLVVVSIIGVLIAMLVPAVGIARERCFRSTCAGRLAAVGQAFLLYGNQEPTFPAVPPPSKLGSAWNFKGSGVNANIDPLSWIYTLHTSYPTQGNALGNAWVLVLQGIAAPKSFICPSDPADPQPADVAYRLGTGTWINFGVANDLVSNTFSYSFTYPWVGTMPRLAFWWRASSKSSLVLGADMGPTLTGLSDDPNAPPGSIRSNSKNHAGMGQNVLFFDGHVSFSARSDVGPMNDCIYTANAGAIYCKNTPTGLSQFNLAAPVTNLNLDPDGNDLILVPGKP